MGQGCEGENREDLTGLISDTGKEGEKMNQLIFEGFDADQACLLQHLDRCPMTFAEIRYQTGWSLARASVAVAGLVDSGKLVKNEVGAFRPFIEGWDN